MNLKMVFKNGVVVTSCFLLMPFIAAAQPRDGSGGFMNRFDADGDKRVSMDEFDGPSDIFNRFDTDGDGFISETEAPTGPPPGKRPNSGDRRQGGFEKDDVNNDGRVSREEFSGPQGHFNRLDADGDGYISGQEKDS